jgi:hypothetical protein
MSTAVKKRASSRKTLKAQTSERKNRWYIARLLGTSSLKEGAM